MLAKAANCKEETSYHGRDRRGLSESHGSLHIPPWSFPNYQVADR